MTEIPDERLPWSQRWDWPLVLLIALVICGTGIGLRDPWPPDEPRFALVAQEMLATGDWLIPRRGGEIYPDKPPLFMWCSAISQSMLGLRWGFLIPSLLAALGVCALVFDLARRLGDRQTGWLAFITLFASAQFVIQARSAQIDMVLTLWTTLSLYGLLRHLLVGPAWWWCWLSALAVGCGVITKGVGFLPLLVLLPWALIRWRWPGHLPAVAVGSWWRWLIFAGLTLVPILAWLVPLLILAANDPALAEYRDEILFKQTAGRYTNAWHHERWFGYLIMMAFPLWSPVSLLLPWLAKGWRDRWRVGDGLPMVLVGWVMVVFLFFSFSSGKRGVYILPALPALAIAAAFVLPAILKHPRWRIAAWWIMAVLGVGLGVMTIGWRWIPKLVEHVDRMPGIYPTATLVVAASGILGLVWWWGQARPWHAWLSFLVFAWIGYGTWGLININQIKSAVPLMTAMDEIIPDLAEVGVPSWREQILLHAPRPITNFGYKRPEQERFADALQWQTEAAHRWLMITEGHLAQYLKQEHAAQAVLIGQRGRRTWYAVPPPAEDKP